MKIRLGLALDSANHLSPSHRLGDWTTGPLGLLGLLELEQGLAAPRVSRTMRVTQYARALEQADTAKRFYSASRSIDPLGVAETLLDWRDALFESGWDGKIPAGAPVRLADLAAVEEIASASLAAGIAQRLKAVEAALANGGRTQINEVTLVDSIDAFPAVWQQVLRRLPTRMASSESRESGSSDLATLQACVTANAQSVASASARHDGSIRVSQVTSLLRDARIVSAWIQAQRDAVVVTDEPGALAEACIAHGIPTPAWSSRNAARPALQLLPLALQLCWAPLDVAALMAFLSHPLCPLDRPLARRLARVVAEQPGIGSRAWREAVAQHAELSPEATDESDGRAAVAQWIECSRYAPADGMPADTAQAIAEALADRLRRRAFGVTRDAEREALMAAVAQCRDFAVAITLRGGGISPSLKPTQIQQMLDLASEAAPKQGADAELGHTPVAKRAGALIEERETVVWWLARPEPALAPLPWSSAEIEALQAVGVQLPDTPALLRQRIREWLRPVQAARKQLLIILPPEGEETHPIVQIVRRALKGLRVETVEGMFADFPIAHFTLPRSALPRLSRWQQLPGGMQIPRRAEESYSSIKTLLDNPHHWVLHYAAQIRPGALPALPDAATLGGQLMHRLSEELFAQPNWQRLGTIPNELDAWCSATLERLIDEEGALLRKPGMQAALTTLRETARRAMWELLSQFRRAGIQSAATESPVEGTFCGGRIKGFADLVVTNRNGEAAVVDLKRSGKRHAEALRDNTHLQLTIYARMLGRDGHLPTAYYLLSTQDLIAQSTDYFPNARRIANQSGENSAQLWTRFETSWKRRREQLDAGEIEVVTEATADLAEPTPADDDGLPAGKPFDRYNPYLVLAGWEVGA
ncbi:PD-(D/E)XK nuclease family protein [Niveibacterium sp. SC-1]|uniref:PD-(D/E)XK nuclease family protein n=1 Tax=Niveibacterium sp. SC-1 TaxID=3135646 RepID=UPI00311F3FD0